MNDSGFMAYTLGIDYGTNSVRAIVVDCHDGREIGTGIVNYPSGKQGVLLDSKDPHLARQHPGDYLVGLEKSVAQALKNAQKAVPRFKKSQVIGIGVDTTGSTPIPVNEKNIPLGILPSFKKNLNAQAWLWKDHTSVQEAETITKLARQLRPQYVAKCGNTYSSEWFWAKILHCLNVDPKVFNAAFSWVELSDYIPSVLAGVENPLEIKRGVCAAGHKAFYSEEWNGLPDKEFLTKLSPSLAELRERLYDHAYDATTSAGNLCFAWAKKWGLPIGIPIAIGEFDVHYGAIGSGVQEGTLVKAIGTSTCDCCVVSMEKKVADIPGICGIVPGAILPGYYGIEAGQSAVGDIFKWWIEEVCQGNQKTYEAFAKRASDLKPGESGLLALDWNNGNRTILVNPLLTGLLVGTTLHTSSPEIYRALIEATAFGARMILERIKEYGVSIRQVVCCGGIAEKNTLLMQIYADVTGCEMRVSRSSQSCALGSAVAAAVVAGKKAGGYDDFTSAQKRMTGLKKLSYRPRPKNQAVYEKLFQLYRKLHDSFGGIDHSADLSEVMKSLLDIKKEQTQ